MMTWTSEISGNASKGMRRNDQIPASTRRSVPVNTRKRFRAHQSIQRAITLHASRGVHAELLAGDGLAVLFRDDGDLPRSAAFELAGALVQAVSFVSEGDLRAHRGHPHRRHGGHEERYGNVRTGNRSAVRIAQLHSNRVAALARRGWVGG